MLRRGLRGVKLVISDAHEGQGGDPARDGRQLAALPRALAGRDARRPFGHGSVALRDRWMRNAPSYVAKGQQSMVSAAPRQAFIPPDRASASQTLRHVADQARAKWPKLGRSLTTARRTCCRAWTSPSSTGPRYTAAAQGASGDSVPLAARSNA